MNQTLINKIKELLTKLKTNAEAHEAVVAYEQKFENLSPELEKVELDEEDLDYYVFLVDQSLQDEYATSETQDTLKTITLLDDILKDATVIKW